MEKNVRDRRIIYNMIFIHTCMWMRTATQKYIRYCWFLGPVDREHAKKKTRGRDPQRAHQVTWSRNKRPSTRRPCMCVIRTHCSFAWFCCMGRYCCFTDSSVRPSNPSNDSMRRMSVCVCVRVVVLYSEFNLFETAFVFICCHTKLVCMKSAWGVPVSVSDAYHIYIAFMHHTHPNQRRICV